MNNTNLLVLQDVLQMCIMNSVWISSFQNRSFCLPGKYIWKRNMAMNGSSWQCSYYKTASWMPFSFFFFCSANNSWCSHLKTHYDTSFIQQHSLLPDTFAGSIYSSLKRYKRISFLHRSFTWDDNWIYLENAGRKNSRVEYCVSLT